MTHFIACARRSILPTLIALLAPGAAAASIIDEWSTVTTPPPPTQKPVAVETGTTALLMLDFMPSNCGVRPRCRATLPAVKKFLDQARAKGMLVVYTTGPGGSLGSMMPEVAPLGTEPVVSASVDKFRNTNLEALLKDKGIRTVIAIGTAAHGAVINTSAAAAMRGLKVVVPVDGVSSAEPYPEQYTIWHLGNAPTIAPNVTITRFDLVTIQ